MIKFSISQIFPCVFHIKNLLCAIYCVYRIKSLTCGLNQTRSLMYIYLFSVYQLNHWFNTNNDYKFLEYFVEKDDEVLVLINDCDIAYNEDRVPVYKIKEEHLENKNWIESILPNEIISLLYDKSDIVRESIDNGDVIKFVVVTIGIQEKTTWMKKLMESCVSVDISKFGNSINVIKKNCLSIMINARDLLCNANALQSMQDPGIPDIDFINKIEESYNYKHVYIIKEKSDKPFTIADTINYVAYQVMNLIKGDDSLARFVNNEGEKIRLLESGTIMIEK